MRRLNQELQQENGVRTNRIKEYNRKKILENHLALQEKLQQKKNEQQLHISSIKKQAIDDHRAKLSRYQSLSKIMKADPYKEEQLKELQSTMLLLNEKLKLGMNIRSTICATPHI